ncbi:MAG TPA: AAA family ATPase, partial [Thermoleophilaceae bacterium]|nr:AAA family ATPase [Thermoleophilaceae bacterium]
MLALHGLVDREQELQTLLSLIDAAAGGRGGIAFLEGPAGIGKTRLLAAAREIAEDRGMGVLTATGSELERDFPFGVVRQLFEPTVAGMNRHERERIFRGAAGHARHVILPEQIREGPPGDPDYTTLYGLYWLTVALAALQPLHLCVDDVHWADGPSLRFLSFLARRLEGLPVLLCGALRPAETATDQRLVREIATEPGVRLVRPPPLTPEGVAELIRDELGEGPHPELVDTCLELTGGNPFYLRSLLSEMSRRGVGAGPEAASEVRGLGAEGISRLLLRRLTALSPGALELAQALSILGDGAALHQAGRLAGLEGSTVAEAAATLERAAIVTGGERFFFVHPVVRTSIYQDIPSAERSERHAEAARMLFSAGADLDQVAAQLLLARPRSDTWAVERLRAAAAGALARGATETAVAYLRAGLAAVPESGPRAEVLHELAAAETLTRDPSAVEHLQESHRLSEDPLHRARVASDLVQVLVYVGQWDPAAALAEAALDELAGRDADLELRLRVMWAGTSAYDARLVEQLDPRLPELRRAAETGGPAGRPLTLLLAALAENRGEPADVVALVERGFDGGRFLAEEGLDSPILGQALMALLGVDELDRAEAITEQVEREARSRGSVVGFALAVGHRGAIASRRGDLAAAESDLRASLDLVRERGQVFVMPTLAWWATDCFSERPGLDDFREIAEDEQMSAAMAPTLNSALLLEARGRSRLADGNVAGAIEALRAAGDVFDALGCVNPNYYPWRTALALALATEDRAEARRLAESELEDARRIGLPRAIGVALRTLGLVEGGEAGLALLRESLDAVERCPSRLERAHSRVELG